MNNIFLARISSVEDLERGFKLKVKPAIDFTGMGKVYNARPPSPTPVSSLGAGFISKPDIGQMCIVYKDSFMQEVQILSYVAAFNENLQGTLDSSPLEQGGFRMQAAGLEAAGLEILRSGTTTWWAHPEAQIQLSKTGPALDIRSRLFSHSYGSGAVTSSLSRLVRYTQVEEDYTNYQDLQEDPLLFADTYPVGAPTSLAGGLYQFKDKVVFHEGLSEAGFLYQISTRQRQAATQPYVKDTAVWENWGRTLEKQLWSREAVVNIAGELQQVKERWAQDYEFQFQLATGLSTQHRKKIEKPLRETFTDQKFFFSKKLNSEKFYSQLLQTPEIQWEQTLDTSWADLIKTNSWEHSYKASEDLFELKVMHEAEHLWKKTKQEQMLSFATKNEKNNNLANFITFGESKIHLKTSGEQEILLEEDKILLKLKSAQQFIEITPESIIVQANANVKLVMNSTGMTFNGVPILLKNLFTDLEMMKSTFGIGAPPGAPVPLNPGLIAKFAVGKSVPANTNNTKRYFTS